MGDREHKEKDRLSENNVVKNGYPKMSLLGAHKELPLYPIEKSFLEASLWYEEYFYGEGYLLW